MPIIRTLYIYVSKDVRIHGYFSRKKRYAYKTVLKTLIHMISNSMRKIGGGTIMLEPKMLVACLFSSRSTDADFRRFGPSVPRLKLLPLDPTSNN
jgi:hypothetical protein